MEGGEWTNFGPERRIRAGGIRHLLDRLVTLNLRPSLRPRNRHLSVRIVLIRPPAMARRLLLSLASHRRLNPPIIIYIIHLQTIHASYGDSSLGYPIRNRPPTTTTPPTPS